MQTDISRSNLDRRSRRGWLTAAPAGNQGMDGSQQLRPSTAAARCTEQWRRGRYSGEAAWGLRRAFFDEV
jgi:hypothetical protein